MEAETKTCCVTGHRDIPAEKMEFVKEALQRAVSYTHRDVYKRQTQTTWLSPAGITISLTR